MPDYGPFAVDPTMVSGLGGARFGQFVSRLLAAEQAVAAVKGSILDTLSIQNMADAGVHARLRHAEATTWVPTGDSAWQFKAGDLSPAECKAEFEARPHSVDCVVRSIHVAHRGSKDRGHERARHCDVSGHRRPANSQQANLPVSIIGPDALVCAGQVFGEPLTQRFH